MPDVIILPAAVHDIKEAANWYNSKQKGLGKKFSLRVRQKISLIRKSPDIYMVRYDDTRTAIVEAFPFMLHFAVDIERNVVVIYAVLHTSRNPDVWGKDTERGSEL